MGEAEKALLGGYLFAYGNECNAQSQKKKCELLTLLHVEDECEEKYVDMLKRWFEKDMLMYPKLQTCPALAVNFAIQNTYNKISMQRNGDTMSIGIEVSGLNQAQEKNWLIEQTHTYLIEKNTFIRI